MLKLPPCHGSKLTRLPRQGVSEDVLRHDWHSMRFFGQKYSMGLSKQRLRLNCIPLITLNILHRTSLAMKVVGKCTQ